MNFFWGKVVWKFLPFDLVIALCHIMKWKSSECLWVNRGAIYVGFSVENILIIHFAFLCCSLQRIIFHARHINNFLPYLTTSYSLKVFTPIRRKTINIPWIMMSSALVEKFFHVFFAIHRADSIELENRREEKENWQLPYCSSIYVVHQDIIRH